MLIINLTIGLDVGDRKSVTCEVDGAGCVVKRATVATTEVGLRAYLGERAPCRVVMEAGTHWPWVSLELSALGHAVVVANPSAVCGRAATQEAH